VAETGFVNLLWLTGLISISLGLINILRSRPLMEAGSSFY